MGILEIILMLAILPRTITPLARERGKSPFLWTLAAIGAWIGGELLVITIYVILYILGADYFGFPEEMERQPATYIANFIGLLCGLACADFVRRLLTSMPRVPHEPVPPPPPTFNTCL
jgi:hypothetical protein